MVAIRGLAAVWPLFGRGLAAVWPLFGRGLAAALPPLFFYPIKLQAAFEAAAGLVSLLLHCLNLGQREPVSGKNSVEHLQHVGQLGEQFFSRCGLHFLHFLDQLGQQSGTECWLGEHRCAVLAAGFCNDGRNAVADELVVLHGLEALDVAGCGYVVNETDGTAGRHGSEGMVSAEASET